MTDDLAAWLLKQIAEDQHRAQAALDRGQPWTVPCLYEDGVHDLADPARECDCCTIMDGDGVLIYDEGSHTREVALHIVRWQPARVLAECDAKRRIIRECGWVTVMQLLALPYADRPGYREEWRP